jgi:transposase
MSKHLAGDPAMKILGMDLGQNKSAWEMLDTVTGEVCTGVVQMADEVLRKFLVDKRADQLVIESGPLAARVHDLALATGIAVLVADPTQDAWRWKNVKRKTDADDASKLVRLAALNQINAVHVPAPAVREWRQLLEYRQALVAEKTRCKNRIRATLLRRGLKLPGGKCGWTDSARHELQKRACSLAECQAEELWRGLLASELAHLQQLEQLVAAVTLRLDRLARADARVARLRSIRGVGPRTAEVIVATLDQPRRFATRRQVAAYAGLVPRRYQSGQMDRSGRITKRGNPLLRQVLNQAAWVAVRCNPALREFFLQVGGGHKKRRKQAIVALMRKLLVISWAMLRDGTSYQAQRLKGQCRPTAA